MAVQTCYQHTTKAKTRRIHSVAQSQQLTDYNGLTALITGASSGIGRLMALQLAKNGARVALVARRKDELEALAEEIRAQSGEAVVLPCDISDRQQAEQAASQAIKKLGSVDLLVNNAGYGGQQKFLDWDLDDVEHIMRVNYFGTVYFAKALLPQMLQRDRGWIVFMSSVSGKIASPEKTAYAATKFAMTGFAESLSLELDGTGINVLTVYPGTIDTPFHNSQMRNNMPEKVRDSMKSADGVVEATFDALAKGKREVTYPGGIAMGYVVKALAPEFLRSQVLKTTKKES
jgi:short-subunit dehydrogenase